MCSLWKPAVATKRRPSYGACEPRGRYLGNLGIFRVIPYASRARIPHLFPHVPTQTLPTSHVLKTQRLENDGLGLVHQTTSVEYICSQKSHILGCLGKSHMWTPPLMPSLDPRMVHTKFQGPKVKRVEVERSTLIIEHNPHACRLELVPRYIRMVPHRRYVTHGISQFQHSHDVNFEIVTQIECAGKKMPCYLDIEQTFVGGLTRQTPEVLCVNRGRLPVR